MNRVRLTQQQVGGFEQRWKVRIPDGSYWYDELSGTWGMDRGPTAVITEWAGR